MPLRCGQHPPASAHTRARIQDQRNRLCRQGNGTLHQGEKGLHHGRPELSDASKELFAVLDDIVEAMLLDRDDHGNLKVSQIPSEKPAGQDDEGTTGYAAKP